VEQADGATVARVGRVAVPLALGPELPDTEAEAAEVEVGLAEVQAAEEEEASVSVLSLAQMGPPQAGLALLASLSQLPGATSRSGQR